MPPEACKIQNCLMNRGYDDAKCTAEINALYACCRQFYALRGDDARCSACPKPDILRRKLEERGLGEQGK
ncbi:Cx9C motif-containing protein 4, mitochondrial [Rhodotorula kratochvilovae]